MAQPSLYDLRRRDLRKPEELVDCRHACGQFRHVSKALLYLRDMVFAADTDRSRIVAFRQNAAAGEQCSPALFLKSLVVVERDDRRAANMSILRCRLPATIGIARPVPERSSNRRLSL